MHKLVLVAISAAALAGCTAREQQILTAGAVGAAAGTIIGAEMSQPYPPPRPMVYVEERRPIIVPRDRYYLPPPRRPRCAVVWENTHRGYVERQVCGNHIP